MDVRYRFVNADKVAEYIKSLPRGIKAAAMREISEYVVGNDQHGLRHDVKYKYVSRKRAYGKVSDAPAGYFSWKQFRYVMAALASGKIRIGRKNDPTKYSQSWRWEQKNSQWDRTQIQGRVPFDRFPSRHNSLVGWRHYLKVVESNMKGAMKAAQKKVDEFIAKKQKG